MHPAAPIPDCTSTSTRTSPAPPSTTSARGLFEAHARDEAGFEDEAGHNQMWFAARDIAFENPVTEDETTRMLARMGIDRQPGAAPTRRHADADAAAPRRHRLRPRDDRRPDDPGCCSSRSRRSTASPGPKACCRDTDLVAGDGEAAASCRYIRADETPHVELPEDGPLRDARPHLGRRVRAQATPAPT